MLQKATIQNNQIPEFKKVKIALNIKDVFDYLENAPIDIKDGFVYSNYSPHEKCERMYLTTENAQRIDFIRTTIEQWKMKNLLTKMNIIIC